MSTSPFNNSGTAHEQGQPLQYEQRHLAQGVAYHKPLHFPTQRPNEHVVLLLRRHWTILARDILQLMVSLIAPPLIIVIISIFTNFALVPGSFLYVLTVCTLSVYYLFSFLAYFHDFVDYHLDIWVVTDQRVVAIEQEGLFRRTVSELNILQVQDVTSEITGKIQTFLDYGQVYIQTAGERSRFVFEQVSHPAEIAKVILQVYDRARKLHNRQQVRDEIVMRRQSEPGFGQQQTGFQPAHTPTAPMDAAPTPPAYAAPQPPQHHVAPAPTGVPPTPPPHTGDPVAPDIRPHIPPSE